jgi:trk system potassium uptake protein TrkH
MLFVSILLMMIGASPCSSGGGIKVSTLMVLVLLARDRLRGLENVRFARRTISEGMIDRAVAVVLLFSLALVLGLTVLLAIEQSHHPHHASQHMFLDALFEVASALGTVGLSTGLTTELGDGGRCILIVLMFIGRLGPISLFVAVSRTRRDVRLEYAKEDVLIG